MLKKITKSLLRDQVEGKEASEDKTQNINSSKECPLTQKNRMVFSIYDKPVVLKKANEAPLIDNQEQDKEADQL